MEPLAAGERGLQLPDNRLARALSLACGPTKAYLGRLVAADLLARDVELNDLHVVGVARRLAETEDPVEPGAHQEHDVGALQQCQGTRRRDRQRMVVRHQLVSHRRTRQPDLCVLDRTRTSSSARDHAMSLPTRTTGRSVAKREAISRPAKITPRLSCPVFVDSPWSNHVLSQLSGKARPSAFERPAP
jgi:hypothetical protein